MNIISACRVKSANFAFIFGNTNLCPLLSWGNQTNVYAIYVLVCFRYNLSCTQANMWQSWANSLGRGFDLLNPSHISLHTSVTIGFMCKCKFTCAIKYIQFLTTSKLETTTLFNNVSNAVKTNKYNRGTWHTLAECLSHTFSRVNPPGRDMKKITTPIVSRPFHRDTHQFTA